MPSVSKALWLAFCAAAALGCITEYKPRETPLNEASLGVVVLQEGGLQITAYLYARHEPVETRIYRGDPFDRRSFAAPTEPPIRLLSGPSLEVFLPYERIEKVEARSWPLWAGVEIGIGSGEDLAVEGPLVVEVGSKEEARRLTDAIEVIRRARLLADAGEPEATRPAE